MEISRGALEAGIRAFKAKKNWPGDFHAQFYAQQARRLAGGVTAKWWSETVVDLRRWRATRGVSSGAVESRGLATLERLKAAYETLPAADTDFGGADWSALSQLFDVASLIKPIRHPSVVFPSKLCHFIRPKQYVVADREMVGPVASYGVWWARWAEAWRVAEPIHEELRAVLAAAAGGRLPSTYPFGTKIAELCAIGTRAGVPRTA